MNVHAFLIKAYGAGDLSDRSISITTGPPSTLCYKPTRLTDDSVLIESNHGNVSLSSGTIYEVVEVYRKGMLPRLITELVIKQNPIRRRQ